MPMDLEALLVPVRRAGECRLDVAFHAGEDEGAITTVKEMHCALGGIGVRNDRQRLDVEHDGICRVFSLRTAVGDHHRDRLAHVAHLVLRDHRLEERHDGVDRVLPHRDLRQPTERTLHLRRRNDGADAEHGGRLRVINSLQSPMRHGAAHDRGMQHPIAREIGDVLPLALQQALVLDALHGLADPGARAGPRHRHGRRVTITSL
jgi:hypothetical protein